MKPALNAGFAWESILHWNNVNLRVVPLDQGHRAVYEVDEIPVSREDHGCPFDGSVGRIS